MSCPQLQEMMFLLSNMQALLCAVKLNASVKASINIPLDVLRSAQVESELIHIH